MTHCHVPVRLLTKRAAMALSVVASALTLGLAGCSTQNAAATAPIEQRLPKPNEALVRSAYVYAFPLMMTDARPTSDPVPAVVGIAIIGGIFSGSALRQLSPSSS